MTRTLSTAFVATAVLTSAASAQEKHFGDWTAGVMSANEGLYAATMNDSGGMIGEYCFHAAGRCIWLLANSTECVEGNKYPVLVNTDTGSATTEIVCMKLGGKSWYAFARYAEIERILKGARRIGLAFPMKNGLFQVSRFSLEGASEAVAAMEKAMNSMKADTVRSTVDEVY